MEFVKHNALCLTNFSRKLKFFASFFQKRSGGWGETPRFYFSKNKHMWKVGG